MRQREARADGPITPNTPRFGDRATSRHFGWRRLDGELRRSRRDRGGAGYVADTQLPAALVRRGDDTCIIVRDGKGQALAYVYFEEEPGRPLGDAPPHPRRGAAHRCQVAKLPELLRLWLWRSMEVLPCCSVRLEPAGGSIGAVLWARVERDSGVRRGSVHRVDHGLKHRQAVGRQANASADHHTVVSLGLEPPFHVESGRFIGPKQAQVRAPSAFGHLLQGQGDSGMFSRRSCPAAARDR
jgi:hypothetical protein